MDVRDNVGTSTDKSLINLSRQLNTPLIYAAIQINLL